MTTSLTEIRQRMRAERRALTAPVRIAAAERIADRILALPGMPTRGFVAGYWAVDGEVSLHALLLRLPEPLTYCLPVLQGEHVMRFVPWRPGEALVANRYGIPEPAIDRAMLLEARELACAVVPVVAFDASCHRIGMGGGWYDRAFARAGADAGAETHPVLVGVGYSMQLVESISPRPWDVAMDVICTEDRVIHADVGLPA